MRGTHTQRQAYNERRTPADMVVICHRLLSCDNELQQDRVSPLRKEAARNLVTLALDGLVLASSVC